VRGLRGQDEQQHERERQGGATARLKFVHTG
jgi:hypothetical protein